MMAEKGLGLLFDPSASEASWELANLTERKNPLHPHMVSKNLYETYIKECFVTILKVLKIKRH